MGRRSQGLSALLMVAALLLGASAPAAEFDWWNFKGESSKGTVDTTAFKKDGPYTLGLSEFNISANSSRIQHVESVKREAAANGCELIITDANGDTQKQISDIQDLVAAGVDAIIMVPNSPTATNVVTRQAIEQGIPVCVYLSPIEGDAAYTCYIGANDYAFAYSAATWTLEKMGGKGKMITLMGIPGIKITEERDRAFRDAIKALPDGGANIEILAEYYTDFDYAKGKQAMETALAAYPRIDGIYSQGGPCARGAIEAMQAAGRPLVPITGETDNGYLKMWKNLKDKTGFESLAPDYPMWIGAAAVRNAVKCLNGEPVERFFTPNVMPVTQETIDTEARMDLSDSYWALTDLPEETLQKLYGEGSGNN